MKKVCVIGLGYIGLPTASFLAKVGYSVLGVDINASIVESIKHGQATFLEKGLQKLVNDAVQSGRLHAAQQPDVADYFIITVPTPIQDDNSPNMDYVRMAVQSIAPYLKPGNAIILESTSPLGSTEEIQKWLEQHGHDCSSLHLAYSPERILPGNMVHELVHNDRVVGGLTKKATKHVAEFYRSFVKGAVLETGARTAELTKLVENSYRDVNIAFANEVSLIAEKHGVDPWELIRFTNCHPRVKILQPGPGVGGHCIAVDPWFLVHTNPQETQLISTARTVNLQKTEYVYQQVLQATKQFSHPCVACLGLSYKPDTEDLRESPALAIARRLSGESNLSVACCEPHCTSVPGVELLPLEKAIARAHVVVFLVKHQEFLILDKKILRNKTVIDTCGVLHA